MSEDLHFTSPEPSADAPPGDEAVAGQPARPTTDNTIVTHDPSEAPDRVVTGTSREGSAIAVLGPQREVVNPVPVTPAPDPVHVVVTAPRGPEELVRVDPTALPDPFNADDRDRLDALPEQALPAGGLDELARAQVTPDFTDDNGVIRDRQAYEIAVAKRVAELWLVNRDRLKDAGSHTIGQTVRLLG